MAPLIVQLVLTAISRWFLPWKDAARVGLTTKRRSGKRVGAQVIIGFAERARWSDFRRADYFGATR